MSITVGAVNDAPVNVLPAGPVVALPGADTPLVGISVADVDAGGDDVEVEFSVDHGTLTVNTLVPGGVGVMQVVGNGTATVTVITASLAQINATLANATGLVYHPDAGFGGPDTLTVTTDDLGHNGAGGALSDTDTLAIAVANPPVADAKSVTTAEDNATTITLSASDADGDDPLTFAIRHAGARVARRDRIRHVQPRDAERLHAPTCSTRRTPITTAPTASPTRPATASPRPRRRRSRSRSIRSTTRRWRPGQSLDRRGHAADAEPRRAGERRRDRRRRPDL